MEKVSIQLNKQEFEANKKHFLNAFKTECPNEAEEDVAYKIEPIIDVDESIFEDDIIRVNGSMHFDGAYIGYISIDIPVNPDLAAHIIEAQVKRYNKVKTMLEAVK